MKKLFLSLISVLALMSGCAIPMSSNQSIFETHQYIVPQTGYYEQSTQYVPIYSQNIQYNQPYYNQPYYIQNNQQYVAPNTYYYQRRNEPQVQIYAVPQTVTVQPRPYWQPQGNYYSPTYTNQPNNSLSGTIGAIAGGVIGSQVGRGNGSVASSAIGAATGLVVGSGCRTVTGGQVIGAIAGGILGSQVGRGNGRTVAAAIGAATGAAIGTNLGGGC